MTSKRKEGKARRGKRGRQALWVNLKVSEVLLAKCDRQQSPPRWAWLSPAACPGSAPVERLRILLAAAARLGAVPAEVAQ